MQISELIETIKTFTDKKGRIKKMPAETVVSELLFYRGIIDRQKEIIHEHRGTIASLKNDLNNVNGSLEIQSQKVFTLGVELRDKIKIIKKLSTEPGRLTRDEKAEFKELRTKVYRLETCRVPNIKNSPEYGELVNKHESEMRFMANQHRALIERLRDDKARLVMGIQKISNQKRVCESVLSEVHQYCDNYLLKEEKE